MASGRQTTSKKRSGRSRGRSTARTRTTTTGTAKRARAAGRSRSRAAQRTNKARRAMRTSSRSSQGRASGQADAISLLKSDHQELRKLLEQLKAAEPGGDRRERLLERVREAIQSHTTIEEEIFYPAFRDAAGNKRDRVLYHEAVEEHHAVDMILPEVQSATGQPDVFPARAKVLKDMIEHHAEEEETEMFPRARKLFPPAELKRLGVEMAARKRSMTKQPTGALGAVAQLFSR